MPDFEEPGSPLLFMETKRRRESTGSSEVSGGRREAENLAASFRTAVRRGTGAL